MQQVFPDDASSASGRPMIQFPLPGDLEKSSRNTQRKRSRSAEAPTSSAATVSERVRLSRIERHALCRFLEYGDQPIPAASLLRYAGTHKSTPAQLLAHSASLPRASVPAEHQWCCTAIRQALSLLCRVVALDPEGRFLRSPSSTAAAASSTATATVSAPPPTSSSPPIRTLELYCRFQALELELEDIMLRNQTVLHADGVPDTVRQQAIADTAATVQCVERSVDALEETLVQMLLSIGCFESCVSGSKSSSSAPPPLEYVAAILRGLPEVFQSEQWPAIVVSDMDEGSKGALHSALAATHTAAADEVTRLAAAAAASPSSTAALLLGVADATQQDRAAVYRQQVGGATTSIALRSLFDVSKLDAWNLFGIAGASPISRLAALEKLKIASTSPSTDLVARPSSRPPLDLEHIDLKSILVRAWNHQYSQLGVRRLHLEMQALFYQQMARVSCSSNKGPADSATTHEVYQLWTQWNALLREQCLAFAQKTEVVDGAKDSEEASIDSLFTLFTNKPNTCTLLRQHALPSSALADVQTATLRVIAKLQQADTKGWFAVPAFDLVNVDFASVRYWAASPSFAHKSKREAYRSLCRVLERMVDNCVQKYGPTHAFSDVITNVRQQLVDVARGEGLL